MAIAHVQTNTDNIASGNSDTLAYSSNVTAGSLLVLGCRLGSSANDDVAVTDSLTQTWTRAATRYDAGLGRVEIWYFANSAGGANTVTISFTGTATTIRWSIHEYSGAATSSVLDQTNTGQGDASPSSGYDITSSDDGLIFAMAGNNLTTTMTEEASYTLRAEVPAAPNTRYAVQDRIDAAGTYSGAFGGVGAGTSPRWMACIASFLEAGAAAPSTAKFLPLLGVG